MLDGKCWSLTRGRLTFVLTVCLTAVFMSMLTTPVVAESLKAYRGSGSLVLAVNDGSVADAHGATVGKIEGDSYYSAGGSLRARLEDRKVYNSSGSQVAKFDGSSIYSAQGSLVGKLEGESLSNSHGATIGRIEGAGSLGDAATAFLACLLLGII
jgi:hypothetical protein